MKFLCLILTLLMTTNLFAKDKVYYIRKKDGKLYKVRKVKKVKKRKISNIEKNETLAEFETTSTKSIVHDNRFKLSAGLNIMTDATEDNRSNSTNNNNDNLYGLEVSAGYQFMANDRISFTPDVFLRRISMTDYMMEVLDSSLDGSARLLNYGARISVGYDFIMENNAVLRPMIIAGYSQGNVKADIENQFAKAEVEMDVKGVEFGIGFEGIMENGLAPFGKLMLVDLESDSAVSTTFTNKTSGASTTETGPLDESGEDEYDRIIVFGLGYWF